MKTYHMDDGTIREMHLEYAPLSDLEIIQGVSQVRPHSSLGYRPPAPEAILTAVTH